MRKTHFFYLAILLCGLLTSLAHAETFNLTDGTTVAGETILGSANNGGIKVRVEDNKYENVPWSSFSQEDLKKFAQNPKLTGFVAPYIEVSPEERLKKTEVKVNPVPRIARPASHSLVGAMFSSGVGLFLIFAMYAGNIYAGYEIAVFRAQPKILVCGVSAVLPVIGPIIFLSMPTRMTANDEQAALEAQAAATPAPTFNVPNPEAEAAAAQASAGGLHLAHHETAASNGLPATQTFQRGAFTFNRRFLETKFSGFFGMVRRDAEKDMVLLIKAARGTYTATRISRIAANDMHVQVIKGSASEEVMIPFSEIQEIQLKHKDA